MQPTAHGIKRTGPCKVSGRHIGDASNEPGVGADSPLYRAFVDLADAREERNAVLRAEYVAKLARHDWSFQRSDDHSVYCAGRDSLAALRRMQKDIDPDGVLWNRHAPEGYKLQTIGSAA